MEVSCIDRVNKVIVDSGLHTHYYKKEVIEGECVTFYNFYDQVIVKLPIDSDLLNL